MNINPICYIIANKFYSTDGLTDKIFPIMCLLYLFIRFYTNMGRASFADFLDNAPNLIALLDRKMPRDEQGPASQLGFAGLACDDCGPNP